MTPLHAMPNAFSVVECERIIASTALAPKDEALLVGQTRDHNQRRAELVWIDQVDGMGWVMERLIDFVRISNRERFDFDLRDFAESPQVATYDAASGGHFAWHSDIGDGRLARQRKLTLVLQLSNSKSYEGGDLQVMPSANILTANREQGCVSIFPSFSLHQVTPITHGIRHSLTVWSHGPSFR
ncbi:2OG-Fe(II) oxygenase [Pacificibacter maritimus]|uniref:2OG-Fe(II) oxygenase n=1 Tax=Pacificibacter maritimus TaxID=762213 RepID=UPI000F5067AD|nr:2OG-Fe(II) oxygenase [Pacificibacter maritimus]